MAGTAAVVLSAFPAYSPAQLRAFLKSRAVDMGASGPDTQFGYGRVHLGNPPTVGDNTPPLLTALPDQMLGPDSDGDNALDLWNYASDIEDNVAALSFTISNTPVVSAGVTLDTNRYVDIQPTLGWSGTTQVEIQVQDTGSLTMTGSFAVRVVADSDGGDDDDDDDDEMHQIYLPAILKR